MHRYFPFVEMYEDLFEVVGNPDPDTRFYQAYGSEDDYPRWFEAVMEVSRHQGVLSPVAAARYIQVTRNAIYKRLKEGRLTGFQFHTLQSGSDEQKKKTDGQPVCFVPVLECMAWRDTKKGLKKREHLEKYAPKQRISRIEMDLLIGRGHGDLIDQLLNGQGGDGTDE